MHLTCVNGGGASSILCLPHVPVNEQSLTLPADARYILELWAARPGEILTARDPQGDYWRLRLTSIRPEIRCIPFARLTRQVESSVSIEVYQALPEKERFELILQKLTELGVTRIVPVESERSITKWQRDAGQVKSHRWPDVIRRAAKQCRRARLPELGAVTGLADAVRLASMADIKLILYEGEEKLGFSAAVTQQSVSRVALIVGPEGGFTEDEVAFAHASGFLSVSLGARILRTETAAIAGAVLLQGLVGDLAGNWSQHGT